MFEFWYLCDEAVILLVIAKPHHRFDDCPVVPASVEKDDLARVGQFLDVAPKIPLSLLYF